MYDVSLLAYPRSTRVRRTLCQSGTGVNNCLSVYLNVCMYKSDHFLYVYDIEERLACLHQLHPSPSL